MNTINVALSGYGNIGARIAAELLKRRPRFRERFGCEVRLVGVCASAAGIVQRSGLEPASLASRREWTSGLTGTRFFDEAMADVLIEAGPNDYVSGGPGLHSLRHAVQGGVDAVMVSKSALALHGAELLGVAAVSGSRVFASGASAAAMPAIDFLSYDLAGAEVSRVEAVLTGTAAFVLDAVMRSDLTLDEAVAEAARRGIAEPDPSFDLDGWDTAAKLVIIAGMAFDTWLDLDAVPRESVRSVAPTDILRWRAAGEKPALVGVLERHGHTYHARVELRTFERGHPFASAEGSTKALFVRAGDLGEYSLIGGASTPEATVAAALKDFEHLLAAR